jgi:hypothetical protein
MSAESIPPSALAIPAAAPRTGVWQWLYNHNPFYIISTLLMLYAVRSAYGVMAIGEINSWRLLAVMGGYTAVLATIGVLIVRWGKVWEDARSIVLLLLLLFLAVSISADDLVTQEASAPVGSRILIAGYLFAAVITEAVIIGTRLHLSWLYRGPLHLFLMLFFAAPWVASPEIQGWFSNQLNLVVFLFPNVAALLFLTLIPAVRRGPKFVEGNGTPWKWPLYPWSAFAFIAFAVAFRSYIFALTFSQSGKIWRETSVNSGDRSVDAIVLDTIWGPYYLVPLLAAILVLLFEGSRTTGNERLTRRTLLWAPWLIVLAMIPTGGAVYATFLKEITALIGSPIWLTVGIVALFYAYAWVRGTAAARSGLLAMVALFSIIGPQTLGLRTMTSPQPIAVLIVVAFLICEAIVKRSIGLAIVAFLLSLGLARELALGVITPLWLNATIVHLAWGGLLILGLLGRGAAAELLRFVAGVMFPIAAFQSLTSPDLHALPDWSRVAYAIGTAAAAWVIAKHLRHPGFYTAFYAVSAILAYAALARLYWLLVTLFGAATANALAWSLATLLIGALISTHKAGWIDRREAGSS